MQLFPLTALALLAPGASAQWSIDYLSEARTGIAAGSVGDLAVFAGGYGGSFGTPTNTVDIYDAATGQWTQAVIVEARSRMAVARAGDLLLFGGGHLDWPYNPPSLRVDLFDGNTRTWSVANLSEPRRWLGGAGARGYAMFGGGEAPSGESAVVDVFDSATGIWSIAALSQPRSLIAATSVGPLILFAGGRTSTANFTPTVDIFDTTTSTWSVETLPNPRSEMVGASIGKYAVFSGGEGINASYYADVYDTENRTWSTFQMANRRFLHTATSLGDQIFIACGHTFQGVIDTVDVYRPSDGSLRLEHLSLARYGAAATTVRDQIMIAGGFDGIPPNGHHAVVDIYNASAGQRYCSPGLPNSSGFSASLRALGTTTATDSDLWLEASSLPVNQFGYFLAADAQGLFVPPGSQGLFCLGGAIGRLNAPGQIGFTGTSGAFTLRVDLTSIPVSPPAAVVAGETWNFQAWHRDSNPQTTSNFTDAVSVTYQ
ncbi:MAG: hypothetical protein GY711_14040 [bacterium]|nr:hypothetical protein [bacterium]